MTAFAQEDLGTLGAQRARYYPNSPDYLLRKLVETNPKMTETELEALFEGEALSAGQPILSAIISYWFANRYRALMQERIPPAVRRAHRLAREQIMRVRVDELKKATIGKVARTLLDKIVPGCDKPLRDMTRADCEREGGWYMRLAQKLSPKQTVGSAGLTDEQLWELYSS